MKLSQFCVCVLVAAFASSIWTAKAAAADQPKAPDVSKPVDKADAVDKDEKVAIADLPKIVVDAVNKAQPGGKITEADKETENGVVVYEVDVTSNAKKFEVKVDATGKVLSNKPDDDDDEKNEQNGNQTEKKK